MNRKLRILQIAIGQMVLEQLAKAIMRNQEVPAPDESEHGPPGDRKDIVAR